MMRVGGWGALGEQADPPTTLLWGKETCTILHVLIDKARGAEYI